LAGLADKAALTAVRLFLLAFLALSPTTPLLGVGVAEALHLSTVHLCSGRAVVVVLVAGLAETLVAPEITPVLVAQGEAPAHLDQTVALVGAKPPSGVAVAAAGSCREPAALVGLLLLARAERPDAAAALAEAGVSIRGVSRPLARAEVRVTPVEALLTLSREAAVEVTARRGEALTAEAVVLVAPVSP
jgi:hypothetical protein